MVKGTPVPTKYGILHVGDIIRVNLYEEYPAGGGTRITEYEGEFIYHENECRFLVYGKEGLSFDFRMAEPPVLIRKWNEEPAPAKVQSKPWDQRGWHPDDEKRG